MPNDPNDPNQPKKPNPYPSLPPGATPPPGYVDPAGPNSGEASAPAPSLGPQVYNPATGTAEHDPNATTYTLGGVPGFPQPQPAPTAPAPAAPVPTGGSADFPSLPPGATPPPGYVDPITGKSAPMAGAPAAPAAPAAPGAAPGAPGAPAGPPQTVNDAYKQAIMKGLTRQPTTDIASDPVLKAQSDAYAVQQQRAREKAQEANAEAAQRTGSSDIASSGSLNAGNAALLERQGEAQGAYNAGLLGSQAQKDRDELLQWAALAGQDLNQDQQRALQSQLAQLDAQIRREGIQSQAGLGQGDLSLRARLGDQSALLQLLGLQQSGNQFDKRLGFDVGQFNASRDDSNFWRAIQGLG